jgi:hypothetical protein
MTAKDYKTCICLTCKNVNNEKSSFINNERYILFCNEFNEVMSFKGYNENESIQVGCDWYKKLT